MATLTKKQRLTSIASDGYFINYLSDTADATKSVRTKVREAWKYNLEQITVANGYHTNVREVNDPPKNEGNLSRFPAINLLWGTEERENYHIQSNNSLVDVRLQVEMDVFFGATKDLPTEQDQILQDIQKMFGIQMNYSNPDSSGDATVFSADYLNAIPWGTDEEMRKAHGGISIIYEVVYKYVLNNPTISCG
jgi:hypothetical protein